MFAGLALPSRPRAIRVVSGVSDSPATGDAAILTCQLRGFVRNQPAQALQVLEDWLELTSSLQAAKQTETWTTTHQAESQGGHTHDNGENHDVRD